MWALEGPRRLRGRTVVGVNVLLVVLVVLLACAALVLCAVGVLGTTGRLPGNKVLGVRTPETYRSREAWVLAHRAAGPSFLGAGLVLALGALGLGLVGGWTGGLVAVVALAVAIVLLNLAGLAGSRAAAAWGAAQEDAGDGCCGGTDGAADGGCAPGDAADPASDCGVSGGCGSCALNGMCESSDSGSAATGAA